MSVKKKLCICYFWIQQHVPYEYYSSYIKTLVDAAVHSEHGKLIKCDFKPGSVERSIDLYQRGYTSEEGYFQHPPPIKIEHFSSDVPLYPILTVLETF
jgi:hypothetical protein